MGRATSADIRRRAQSRVPLAAAAAVATALPFAVGALRNGWIEAGLLGCILWYVLAPQVSRWLENALLVVLSLCVAISGTDLMLRPLIGSRLHAMPMNTDTRMFPRLPILGRWDPNVSVTSEGFGDLAAMLADSGRLRERRTVVFRTDEAGFRNDPVRGPIDLLVLGDSFSAGAGTSQEDMFSHLLEHRHGRHTYNLAFPGSPWQEYINFLIESPRLSLASGAVVVWTIFTGNDLDDFYGTSWKLEDMPWRGSFRAWGVRYHTFRRRSPIRQLVDSLFIRLKGPSKEVEERVLPDGRPILFMDVQEKRARQTVEQVERHPNFQKLERTLAAMRDAARERALTITVLLFPTKGEVYRWILEGRDPRPEDGEPSGFARAVLAACSRTEVQCVDTKPVLIEEARRRWAAEGNLLWWRDDTHLNAAGNAVIADFIAHHVLAGTARTRL